MTISFDNQLRLWLEHKPDRGDRSSLAYKLRESNRPPEFSICFVVPLEAPGLVGCWCWCWCFVIDVSVCVGVYASLLVLILVFRSLSQVLYRGSGLSRRRKEMLLFLLDHRQQTKTKMAQKKIFRSTWI